MKLTIFTKSLNGYEKYAGQNNGICKRLWFAISLGSIFPFYAEIFNFKKVKKTDVFENIRASRFCGKREGVRCHNFRKIYRPAHIADTLREAFFDGRRLTLHLFSLKKAMLCFISSGTAES